MGKFIGAATVIVLFVSMVITTIMAGEYHKKEAELQKAKLTEAATQGALFAQACDAETAKGGSWSACFRRKLGENGYQQP